MPGFGCGVWFLFAWWQAVLPRRRVLSGKRVADRLPGTTLTKAFVALLFAVAAYVAIRSSIALAT